MQPVLARARNAPPARRAARRIALGVGLCVPLGAALFGAAAAPAASAPHRAALAPAAQPGPPQPDALPPLEVALYGEGLTVRTLPGVVVLAELEGPDGAAKADGQSYSGPDGRADLRFFAFDDPDADPVVRPGDRLRVVAFGERPWTVEVPRLVADVDVAGDRVLGEGPPGARLDLALTLSGPTPRTIERVVPVDADGLFVLDLGGEVDLAPGGVTGAVRWVDGEGRRFTAHLAALRADLTLGSGVVRGAVTPGTTVGGAWRAAAGDEVALPIGEATGDGTWSARLEAPGGPPEPGPFGPQRPEHPLAAGDVLTLTVSGGPLGVAAAGRVLTVTVPALSVAIDRGDDTVAGTGPADAVLILEASALDGTRLERAVTTDGEGRFVAALGDAVDLAPGWRVRVAWEAAPGVRVGAVAVVPVTSVGIGTDLVRGLAEVGARVTVTLRSAAGEVLAVRPLRADDRGEYRTPSGFLLGEAPPRVAAGMRIEVARVAGDPRVLTVPALTAATEDATGHVVGVAPPGATVRVAAAGAPPGAVVTAVADASGAYRADLAPPGGAFDGPLEGATTLAAADGFEVVARWAVVRLGLSLGDAYVVGNGPLGRTVVGELVDPAGVVVARAQTATPDFTGLNVVVIGGAGTGGFDLEFRDLAGEPVPIRPGDTLRVQAGDGRTTLVVPPLSGAVFVSDDVVTGRTRADTEVTLRVVPALGGSRVEAVATSDADGAFAHAFTGALAHDIRYRDRVQLEIRPGGHRVTTALTVPGLDLDLDGATLRGALTPGARLVVAARRGGAALAETTLRADADGAFALTLDAGGAPVALRPDDEIEVVDTAAGGESLRLVVPELRIEAAAGSPDVRGRATPGGLLVVLATGNLAGYVEGTLAQAWPEISADGAWTAAFLPRTPPVPGLAFVAQYQLPSGHVVRRTAFVPLLVADHGGARACGVAAPAGAVEATLAGADGAPRAAAAGRPAPDGRFGLALRDAAGGLVATRGGDTLRAMLGATPAALRLPPLDLTYDRATGAIAGTGAPGAEYAVTYPTMHCVEPSDERFLIQLGGPNRVAEDGTVRAFFPPDLVTPGTGFEMAFGAPDGHRVRRTFWRALGRVHVDTPRVTGVAQPLAAVTATLRAPGGALRALAVGTAGAEGAFDLALAAADGAPVASAPGDELTLEAAEDVAPPALIPVAALSFDWSPGRPIGGIAPPGRFLVLAIRLADGRTLTVGRVADEAGRFGLAADEVPPRATWSLADVVGLRAALATDEGHEIVAETAGFDGPPPGGGPIFLPATLRGAALDGGPAWRSLGAPPAAEVPARVRVWPAR